MTDSFFPGPSAIALSPIVEKPPHFSEPPVTAWSFSRLSDFEACQYKVLLATVHKAEKGPELPTTHPLEIGNRTHSEAEFYILGSGPLTKSISKMQRELAFCKEMYEAGLATVEQEWGFDAAWEPVGWHDEFIWLRVKCDVTVMLDDTSMIIYDWKSGRSDGNEVKQMQQAQLYVAAAFMRFPNLEMVEVCFGFFKDGKLWRPRQTFTRKRALKYIQRWSERAGELTSCVEFLPKPNSMNCKYCPFGYGEYSNQACAYGVEL